mmetsp:Transcript_89685/g.254289  ORF Transcript_89685/g.254289 Transcript_89685/m.254289 type:complete len:180 (-) Transcript_89685:92-631(-)
MPVWDQLSPRWAETCRNAGTGAFAWAHNGTNRNGVVELQENGRLQTSWCEGSWKVKEDDPDVVVMSFGSSDHWCRIKDGGFVVENKFRIRTGANNLRPGAPLSCGWVQPGGADTGRRAARPNQAGPRKRKERAGDADCEEHAAATFSQKELKFEAFSSRWSARSDATKRRLLSKTQAPS